MISDKRKAFEEWAVQDDDEKPAIDRNGRYIQSDLQLLWEGWDAATQKCQDDEDELERRPRIILAPVWQVMKARSGEAIPIGQPVYANRAGATAYRGAEVDQRLYIGKAQKASTPGEEYVTVSMLNMDAYNVAPETLGRSKATEGVATEPRFPEDIAEGAPMSDTHTEGHPAEGTQLGETPTRGATPRVAGPV